MVSAMRSGSKANSKNVVDFATKELPPVDEAFDQFQGERPKDLNLTPELLIELWENGFIPDSAYIVLALKMDGDDKALEFENFCFRWAGTTDDRGKRKELKPSQVEKTFVDLKKKGAVQTRQLMIDFSLLY